MQKCKFCNNRLAVLIEFDEESESDPAIDKWTCSDCEERPTFIFKNNLHMSTEFWFPKEFDERGRLTMSLVLCQNFATYIECRGVRPTFALEILECRGPSFMKPIYQSNEWTQITPYNAKQKLETIITFR